MSVEGSINRQDATMTDDYRMLSLYKYIRSDKERVQGWLGRVDGQIFYELLLFQNASKIDGGVAEIGVHHGKSFIALCLAMTEGQKAYAIDVFENQQQNLDNSGKGDKDIFIRNLSLFNIPSTAVVIDPRASDQVTEDDIRNAVGSIRFFSIDGGHWREVVKNDLLLANSVLAEAGVIALDDFMRPEWPEVSLGLFDWYEDSKTQIVPLAIGFNKLYLCRRTYLPNFRKCLEESTFLRLFLTKYYEFYDTTIPVFQSYQLPESGLRRRLREYLKLYHPDTYVKICRSLIALRARSISRSSRQC